MQLYPLKTRLLIAGSFVTVLGLALFIVKGLPALLILPVVGIVVLIAGILYKPRNKDETPK